MRPVANWATSTEVVAVSGDVTDACHRRELVEAAADLGPISALVNNAGALGPSPQPAVVDYPLEVLERVYRTNVIAPMGLLQDARPHLAPAARLLNITSDAAVEAYAGWGGYGSSKAALEQWSAVLAVEQSQMRVYTVDPGDMRTAMHQRAFPDESIDDRPSPRQSVPGLVELLDGDHPSGRYRARDLA